MKSKRRHELQTNELADQLGQWIEVIRPHVTTILLAVVAAAAILFVWYYWASSREKLETQSWRAYLYASGDMQADASKTVEELNSVAEDYTDTPAGLWAKQSAADIEAGQGVYYLFQQKQSAEDHLYNAIVGYRTVLGSELISENPMLQCRAHFGLAQAYEAYMGEKDEFTVDEKDLNKGLPGPKKVDCREEARKNYQAVVDMDEESSLAEVARRRLDRLEGEQGFYVWLAQQTPAPPHAGNIAPEDDIGSPGSDLDQLIDRASDNFMKDLGGAESSETPEAPAQSTEAESGAEGSPADDSSGAAPAKKAADTSGGEAPAVEGPKIDGPGVEPPENKPAKEAETKDGESS
jgi:predicted negative regulator of RcsB-dependent stress response